MKQSYIKTLSFFRWTTIIITSYVLLNFVNGCITITSEHSKYMITNNDNNDNKFKWNVSQLNK